MQRCSSNCGSNGDRHRRCRTHRAAVGGATGGERPRKVVVAEATSGRRLHMHRVSVTEAVEGELRHRERDQAIQCRTSAPHPHKTEGPHSLSTVWGDNKCRMSTATCRCEKRISSGNKIGDSTEQDQDHQVDLALGGQTMDQDRGGSQLLSGLGRGSRSLLDLRICSSSITMASLLNRLSRRYSTITMEILLSRWSPRMTTTCSKSKTSGTTIHLTNSNRSNRPNRPNHPNRQPTNTSSSNNYSSIKNQKTPTPGSPTCKHKTSLQEVGATSGQSTRRPLRPLPLHTVLILTIYRRATSWAKKVRCRIEA